MLPFLCLSLAGVGSAARRCRGQSSSTDHLALTVVEVYVQTSSGPVPTPALPSAGCLSVTRHLHDPVSQYHSFLTSNTICKNSSSKELTTTELCCTRRPRNLKRVV